MVHAVLGDDDMALSLSCACKGLDMTARPIARSKLSPQRSPWGGKAAAGNELGTVVYRTQGRLCTRVASEGGQMRGFAYVFRSSAHGFSSGTFFQGRSLSSTPN